MKKIFLDPGHGGTDPGAVFKQLQEKQITLQLATNVYREIQKRQLNVAVKMSRKSDKTVSLNERTHLANEWGADLFLSFHVNAGGGTGYEDFIHSSLNNTSQTARIRQTIHKAVVARNQLNDRGKKRANFHVLRETNMPAILTENGFIDSTSDRKLLQNDKWIQQTAKGFVEGIIHAFHLQRVKKYYRVIAGSYRHYKNAKQQIEVLQEAGFDSFIHEQSIDKQKYYRVIAGSFTNLTNANKHKETLKKKGFATFIATN